MLSVLFGDEQDWQHQVKGLGKNQQQVLNLLGIEDEKYQKMTPNWWLNITDRGG